MVDTAKTDNSEAAKPGTANGADGQPRTPAEAQKNEGGHDTFLQLIRLIERLHRRFLDVVKAELERRAIEDINNGQAVLLTNIETENLTIGELTNRGYYMGSNVSYNVKKLVENGYLIHERSTHDRRSSRVRLSEKGLALTALVNDLFAQNVIALADMGLDGAAMDDSIRNLRVLERFWSDTLNYGPR